MLNRERRRREEGAGPEEGEGEGVCPAAVGAAMPATKEIQYRPTDRARSRGSGELRACCVVLPGWVWRAAAKKGRRVKTDTNVFACNVRVAVGRAAGKVNHLLLVVGGEK